MDETLALSIFYTILGFIWITGSAVAGMAFLMMAISYPNFTVLRVVVAPLCALVLSWLAVGMLLGIIAYESSQQRGKREDGN
jgi:hypothetical protein